MKNNFVEKMLLSLNDSMTLGDAFELLDISENSSLDDLKIAYRKAAKLSHPDKRSPFSNKENFILITEAYKMILNSSIRLKRYKDQKREQDISIPDTLSVRVLGYLFDNSDNVWEKLELAEKIYLKNSSYFIEFATRRISVLDPKIAINFMILLAKTRSPEALYAISKFLLSREKRLSISAYLALESAGAEGNAIVKRKLESASARFYIAFGFISEKLSRKRTRRYFTKSFQNKDTKIRSISYITRIDPDIIMEKSKLFKES